MSCTEKSKHRPRPRSNDLLTFLAESEGFCCTFAFIKAYSKVPTRAWAAQLGVSVKLVQQHRRLYRAKITRCRELPEPPCMQSWISNDLEEIDLWKKSRK